MVFDVCSNLVQHGSTFSSFLLSHSYRGLGLQQIHRTAKSKTRSPKLYSVCMICIDSSKLSVNNLTNKSSFSPRIVRRRLTICTNLIITASSGPISGPTISKSFHFFKITSSQFLHRNISHQCTCIR